MGISVFSLLWFVVAIACMAHSFILKRQCRALELRLQQSGFGSKGFDEIRSPPEDSEDLRALRFLLSSDPPSTAPVEQAKLLMENDDESFSYLACLTDAEAEALAKHEGGLSLNGLTTLTDAQAEALAKHEGYLNLDGLTELSDRAAAALRANEAISLPDKFQR